jgi:hypothetical protein
MYYSKMSYITDPRLLRLWHLEDRVLASSLFNWYISNLEIEMTRIRITNSGKAAYPPRLDVIQRVSYGVWSTA